MATGSKKMRGHASGTAGGCPTRSTAAQVMTMIANGIIADDEDVELWDGILYKMTKDERHNQIVMLTADALRTVTPRDEYHVREEKSNSDGLHSLPEPDVTAPGQARRAHARPPRPGAGGAGRRGRSPHRPGRPLSRS